MLVICSNVHVPGSQKFVAAEFQICEKTERFSASALLYVISKTSNLCAVPGALGRILRCN